ncbi:MAG: hypothetical protein DMF49_00240 [Acidobacteria bacterium]|nr:MAG: hypothetical protein DMF49_00240 [Acidobacteriota bacterium]
MPRHPVPLLPENLESGLRSSHLPALDGLRAVAVFLVVFHHFGIRAAPGGLGVIIFFVLSGFLITWLLLGEDERFGTVSVRKFCARRFLRICPVFYFYWLLLIALLLLLHKKIVWEQAIASALFASNYYQAILGDPNTGFSHTWALSVVAQFYLLWPVIFLALRKDRIRLAKALAGIILAVWAYRGLLHSVLGVAQGYVFEAFDTRADHLAIGCLLWRCLPGHRRIRRESRAVRDHDRAVDRLPTIDGLELDRLEVDAVSGPHFLLDIPVPADRHRTVDESAPRLPAGRAACRLRGFRHRRRQHFAFPRRESLLENQEQAPAHAVLVNPPGCLTPFRHAEVQRVRTRATAWGTRSQEGASDR